MADYYPLIARAVEGLPDRSPPTRHAVYERARSALLEQLRSLDPPLPEADIERERFALDDAIERVEAEFEEAASKTEPKPAPAPRRAEVAMPAAVAAAGAAAAPVPAAAAPPPPEERHFETRAFEPQPVESHYPEEPEPLDHLHVAEPVPPRPRVDSRSPALKSSGQGRAIVLGLVLALVIGAIAVAAWFLRDDPDSLTSQPPVAVAPVAPLAEPEGAKFDERVGGGPPLPSAPGAAEPGPRQDVAVAQRAIFYEEDATNPQKPREFVGRAVWRLEGVNAGQGQPLETAVRATVEFPEAGMTMNMLLRRNLDPTLPASHTIELSFSTPPGDTGRVVRDVGLLQFKNDLRGRGTPVAGLPVPVRENLFLIGLSNLNADVERNIELLVRRNWIDLPIRMVSGQRAIISFEKGVAGEQVMNDAFRQWQ